MTIPFNELTEDTLQQLGIRTGKVSPKLVAMANVIRAIQDLKLNEAMWVCKETLRQLENQYQLETVRRKRVRK